jgi:hypothetical protein
MLFSKIVIMKMCHGMPQPELGEDIKRDVANGFYQLDIEESYLLLKKYVTETLELIESRGFNKKLITEIGRNYGVIELYKISIFERVPKKFLDRNPKGKVIIGVNRIATLEALKKAYKKYNPVVFQGSVNATDRTILANTFNNDPKCRVLIGITSVISTALNLQDRRGDEPRAIYISPSWNLKDIEQLRKRTDRVLTKSDVYVRIVYARGVENEQNLIQILSKSSGVLKGTLGVIADKTILVGDFPDDYSTD